MEMASESAFLLKLAMKYVNLGLFDQALEVLGQIPESETEAYLPAQYLTLHTHLMKNDYDLAITLAEALGGAENLPALAAQDLATAYWNTGFKAQARDALKSANWHVPGIQEMESILKDMSPDRVKPKPESIEAVLVTVSRLNLGYHFILENIAPLIWNSRPATSCFDFHIPFLVYTQGLHPSEAKKGHLAVATVLYLEFQIYAAFLPYFAAAGQGAPGIPQVKIYLSQKPDIFSRVRELENLYWDRATLNPDGGGWGGFLEKEAELLGYPECCTRTNINLFTQGVDFKSGALADLVRENLRTETQPDLPFPHYAYFTFQFFPCHPRCSAAEALGHHLAECYQKGSSLMHQIYTHMILPLNQGFLYRQRMSYARFIEGFDEALEARLGKFGRDLAQHRTGKGAEESTPEK
jgi:tetratricopeptide (TPR) repeat protein